MNAIIAEAASTKGAVYFHFDSKEAIARELINHWLTALRRTRQLTDESAIPAIEQLAAFFNDSAALIVDDALARAGLRLTTEASLDTARPAFREWVELVSRLVNTAMADGQLPAFAAQRLEANLCGIYRRGSSDAGTRGPRRFHFAHRRPSESVFDLRCVVRALARS
ncbi:MULTISPECIES: TetR/AcrR family transcriptional regulator [unclassified Rhodococcus (in: high G+C Gram-positive bacteria)]|uniref:TetR/AcrR family transcriptional regulator n=1 Tax=unclassified Rhodococcus (in: high G+C Gram-positive bacteria) TaxID=192944 RepID=UPI00215B780D|nr:MULTISPECIES: TetR/AcrR family transcriptional regulator [unclassified Rhodococcus (in: high G+C Gram-positive bacteria)]